MGKILCMETATGICSVAVAEEGRLMALMESSAKNLHASNLTIFVEDVLKSAGVVLTGLDAIAVSMGPGSYTGLRIGVATAKGFCYALDKPLIAVPTLQAMALGMHLESPPYFHSGSALNQEPEKWGYCPMIDARRLEVFCAIFDETLHEISETRAEIIHENSFRQWLLRHPVVFAGEGAEKCKPFLKKYQNAVFLDHFQTSSKFMIPLAEEKFQSGAFENPVYFEPFYLKDFVAGKPRVKGLES